MDVDEIRAQVCQAAEMLLEVADPDAGEILVLGVSTSEIQGKNIGSASSERVATAVFEPIFALTEDNGLYLAVQCCEHLNRCLVVTEEAVWRYRLPPVTVIPSAGAGGAVSTLAMQRMENPVTVQSIQGHMGMDIGDTFIGMHLRPVVVPVRIHRRSIGDAHLTMARNRPPLIGGSRAQYPEDAHGKRVRYPDCR